MVYANLCEDLERLAISDDPKKFFQVSAQLPPQEKGELVEFLKKNVDVFAWNACKAPGVNMSFICHHLTVNPSFTPRSNLLSVDLRNTLMLLRTR